MSYSALSFKKKKSLTRGIIIFLFMMTLMIYGLETGLPCQLIHYLSIKKFPFDDILLVELPSYSPFPLESKVKVVKAVEKESSKPEAFLKPPAQNSSITKISPQITCSNGFDSDFDLSSVASKIQNSKPYQFIARYLGGPCYPGKSLSASEALRLSNTGFWLISIYSGANKTVSIHGGKQSYTQGLQDGRQAVSLAKSVRQPVKSAIYLDLEAGQLNPNHYLSYLKGWVQAVRTIGYIPGVYSSTAQLDVIHRQVWAANSILYWDAHWVYSNIKTPAPNPSKDLSYAQIWQYVKQRTLCGKQVDIDSAKNLKGMWKIS